MKNKYVLMHKDIAVASIILDDTTNLIIGYKPIHQEYSPFLGTCDLNKIEQWWTMRSVPASREMMQKVIRNAGCLNAEGYLAKNLALSMTDSYWICPSDSNLQYDDVNLRNFSEFQIDKVPYHNETTYDPNASLTGQMDKYWDLTESVPVLVKNSTSYYGQQALNEVLATIVHQRQDTRIPFTEYTAERIAEGEYACKCHAFTSNSLEFVPAIEVVKGGRYGNNMNSYQGYIHICSEHGISEQKMSDFMDYQTLTDFLLSNDDEHLANFGILRDPDTMEFIGPAPIYDTGNSMFFRDTRSVPYTRAGLLKRQITSFYKTEEKMLLNVQNKKIVDIERLPAKNEIEKFYCDNGIPEEKAVLIATNYQTKIEMLSDFQHGIKISFYNEKKKEETQKSHPIDIEQKIQLQVIAGIPNSGKSNIVKKIKQQYEQQGYRQVNAKDLYPVDRIETEYPYILDMKKVLSSIYKTTDEKGRAFVIIKPNDIRMERSKLNLPDSNALVFDTVFARIRQALLNNINVIYCATNTDRQSRENFLRVTKDLNISRELTVKYMSPEQMVSQDNDEISFEKLTNMAEQLYYNKPNKDEGWDKIVFIGTDPIQDIDGQKPVSDITPTDASLKMDNVGDNGDEDIGNDDGFDVGDDD